MATDELKSSIQRTAYDSVAVESVKKGQMFASAAAFVLAATQEGVFPDPSLMSHLAPGTEWPDALEIVEFLHSQARTEAEIARDVEKTKNFIS